MNRCRNCGDPEHRTQECAVYGPWYPLPGLTADHYAKQAEDISHLVAADILAEHEENHIGGEHERGGAQGASASS